MRFDYAKIATRRDAVVNQLYKGVQFLMKKNKIEVIAGSGRLRDRNTLDVGAKQLRAKNLIVATGSTVKTLPGLEYDGDLIISSDHATHLDQGPRVDLHHRRGRRRSGVRDPLQPARRQGHPARRPRPPGPPRG